ncbi:MAG: L,D-transpeptidase family protein [Verrucomicrobiales bacterium]|nr:L,D-transpeptidase family protein [Verrucomicrobiales bacterium]
MTQTQIVFLFIAVFSSFLNSCTIDPYGIGNGKTTYLGSVGGNVPISELRGPIDTVSFWDEGSASGKPFIRISLKEQKAKFYKGGTLVGISKISSGREGHGTPPGKYEILQKNANHVSNIYGVWKSPDGMIVNDDVDLRKQPVPPPGLIYEGAPMPNFMRITPGGVGMHAGYIPGYPASHGCIRMPERMSQVFFNNISLGTTVIVEP